MNLATKSIYTSNIFFIFASNLQAYMIILSHRIQLIPNNKQKTYFRKAIGCARLAYNWGLNEWQQRYKGGEKQINGWQLRKSFNARKHDNFPFVKDVTKWATEYAFNDLQRAFENFFAKRSNYPVPHKKKEGKGSFYIGSDKATILYTHKGLKHLKGKVYNIEGKHQYVNIPKLGYVKMSERLRFNGKVMGVRISQEGDKFFASFQVKITEKDYLRTHPNATNIKLKAVGIDFGLKEVMTLSDGVSVHNPRTIQKHQRKITRLTRQLSKRQYARTKQERLNGVKQSNNYKKLAAKLNKEQKHVANIRKDFQHKLTTILTTQYKAIAIEDLNVSGMVKIHSLAKSVYDASFYELRRQIEYKSTMNGVSVTVADQFYPSSKTCSHCGAKKNDLTLKDRTFVCPKCGFTLDRDLNAAMNLRSIIKENVGVDCPELTPADLAALLSRFALNGIATSKVETGRQHEILL